MSDYPGDMPTTEEVSELANQIGAVLRTKNPGLIGAALADVVAMFFAGHHPDLRAEIIEPWIDAMRDLIKINERALLKQFPNPWGEPTN